MNKNRVKYSRYQTFLSLFVIAAFLVAVSCKSSNTTGPDPKPEPQPEPEPADTAGAVAPDGTLETVTWNIEWYGSTGNGPDDEQQQTNNVTKVVDSLKADLYAFQEISNQESLNKVTNRMKGYRGFTAEHITYNQRLAFVFNTQTIDSISSGPIAEFQDEDDWAGRLPFYFKFNYSFEDTIKEIYAVVVHAKCCPDSESYQRRKRAAQSLHDYLTRMKPNANIVVLGDYNDDVDVSIYQENETPYQPFVADSQNFFIASQALTAEGVSSTVGFDDMVDHITASNEMEAFYINNSIKAFAPMSNFIEGYGSSTSDHYPIIAEFDMRR